MSKLKNYLGHIVRNSERSSRRLARILRIAPGTVGNYRRLIALYELDSAQIEAMTTCELEALVRAPVRKAEAWLRPDWDDVVLQLQRGFNRQELYDAYAECAEGRPVMAYRTFCKHLGPLLDVKVPTMRLIHRPGEKMMMDFAGYRPEGLNAGQEKTKFDLFVAILPASAYSFACVTASQTIPDWIWANEQAFRFFGGVTVLLVSDNLKAAVVKHPRRGEVVVNPTFAMFCEHYGTTLEPARPIHPKDKAAVERMVQLIQRLLRLALLDRPLLTLTQMNALLLDIVARINRKPVRRLIQDARVALFEKLDQPALAELPATKFAWYQLRQFRKLPADYHVPFENVAYSVPHRLIGAPITLRASRAAVEIHHDGKLVATHPRCWEAGTTITDPAHMPPNHLAWRAVENDDLLLWATGQSEDVRRIAEAEAARGLTGTVRKQQFRLLTGLPRQYGQQAFEAACARACLMGAPSLRHVRNILANHLQNMPVANSTAGLPPIPATDNIRGAGYYAEDQHHA